MKQDKLSNFIPISRELFDHALWHKDKKKHWITAWLFLISEARFQNSKVIDKGVIVHVKRGQLYNSLRFYAKAFGWSTKQVTSFLNYLESDGMIKKETVKETGQTLITLCNYAVHNGTGCIIGGDEETPKKHQRNAKETPKKRRGNAEETKSNNYNKDNNYNNDIKEPKSFFINGVQVAISENYHKALDEMQNDIAWIETNTINLRMIDRTLTPDRLKEKIIEFFVLRTNEGNIDTPTTQSMKQHFANWLRQDLSKQNKQLNNEQQVQPKETIGAGIKFVR